MSIDLESKVLLFIFLLLILFSTLKYILIYVFFILFVYLFGFFFTTMGMDIDVEKWENSIFIYKETTGEYDLIHNKIEEFYRMYSIISKSNKEISKSLYKNKYIYPFGIFYDNPIKLEKAKNKSKLNMRSAYGLIIRKDIGEKEDSYNVIESTCINYLMNEGYQKKIIKDIEFLKGNYFSYFNILFSYGFIRKLLVNSAISKFFTRLYNPKWKESRIRKARNSYKKNYGLIVIPLINQVEVLIPIENEQSLYFNTN